MPPKNMSPIQERRKKSPKKRKIRKERRGDMRIITSASESDIYIWAVSIALMAAILGVISTLAILGAW